MSEKPEVAWPPSHVKFAMLAARIAQKASAWAADCLVTMDGQDKPMRPEALRRFTDEITQLVEACNGR